MTLEAPPVNLDSVPEGEAEVAAARHHRLSSVIPIVLFSYVGTLIRLGLSMLGNAYTPLAASFWSNFLGCMIMGFVVEQKMHLQHQCVDRLFLSSRSMRLISFLGFLNCMSA